MKPKTDMVSGYDFMGRFYYNPGKLQHYLEGGGTPNADCGGAPLIHVVALHSHGTSELELLLKAGAKPNPKNSFSTSRSSTICELLWRSKINNWVLPWDKIEVLVQYGLDLNEPYGNGSGYCPIHDLMSYIYTNVDSGRIVRRLIKLGARIDIPAQDGVLPLHLAAAFANYQAAATLIRAGTKVDVVDDLGRTPLHHACGFVHSGDERVMALCDVLFRYKADINLADNVGETPLIKLAKTNVKRTELARYLLSRGADPSLSDNDGMTAKHWAIASYAFDQGRPENRPMVELLGGLLKR